MESKPDTAFMSGKLFRIANAVPYGIVAGICGIVAFFATVGFVVAHVVLSGIAGATNSTSSIFENWWQVLLFVVDLVFILVALGALVMFIIRVVLNGRARKAQREMIEEGTYEGV